MKIMIINGPSLNMLGIREPEIYGRGSYEDLVEYIKEERKDRADFDFVQTNHEGVIIDEIQRAYFEKYDGIIINPGAYSHTSIAIMDAIKSVDLPCVEVHISNLMEREDYRQHSYISEAAIATISGKGFEGYKEAVDFLLEQNRNQTQGVMFGQM